MSEKFCLKWKNFQQNLSTSFGSLRENYDFTDVTLACGDGQQVEAHKVILAACSPFFQNLLKTNKHPHPLIYMRGVKAEDLVAVIDFMYFGEAMIHQEDMDNFWALAQELNIKGLASDVEGTTVVEDKTKHIHANGTLKEEQEQIVSENEIGEVVFENVIVGNVTLANTIDENHFNDIDDQIRSYLVRTEQKMPNGHPVFSCQVCDKKGHRTSITNHIESYHIEGSNQPCKDCGKSLKSRAVRKLHKCSGKKSNSLMDNTI